MIKKRNVYHILMVIMDKPTMKAVVPIVKVVLANYLENVIAKASIIVHYEIKIAGFSENGWEDKDGICYGHYYIDNYYDLKFAMKLVLKTV